MSKQSLFEKLKRRKWLRKKHSLKNMFVCELSTQYDVEIHPQAGYGFPYILTWKEKNTHLKVLKKGIFDEFEDLLTGQMYDVAGDSFEEGAIVVSKCSMIDWEKEYILKGYVTNGELIEINEKLNSVKSN